MPNSNGTGKLRETICKPLRNGSEGIGIVPRAHPVFMAVCVSG